MGYPPWILGQERRSSSHHPLQGDRKVRFRPCPSDSCSSWYRARCCPCPQEAVEDCYTSSTGHTRTLGNFVKAVFAALGKTYGYLSPELWRDEPLKVTPYQEYTDFLAKAQVIPDSN